MLSATAHMYGDRRARIRDRLRGGLSRMSNQAEDTPIETDESEAADSPAEHDERAHDESSGTSTSDLPQGAKDGELPPAP